MNMQNKKIISFVFGMASVGFVVSLIGLIFPILNIVTEVYGKEWSSLAISDVNVGALSPDAVKVHLAAREHVGSLIDVVSQLSDIAYKQTLWQIIYGFVSMVLFALIYYCLYKGTKK